MNIIVYRSGKPWATPIEDNFIRGLNAHGEYPESRRYGDWYPADVVVIWGHRADELFEMQRRNGGHYLVMERGYIGDIHNRRKWTSLGFDGLNGRATFPKAADGGARWETNFGQYMKPYKGGGDYVLVCGQVPGDASLRGFDIEAWAALRCRELEAFGYTPRFRPHPNSGCPERPLAQDLAGAQFIVTFNSNTGVDATLAGVPAVAEDEGAMIWPIAAHDFRNIDYEGGDRIPWAHDLAWCQWRIDEIASGEAWNVLQRVVTTPYPTEGHAYV